MIAYTVYIQWSIPFEKSKWAKKIGDNLSCVICSPEKYSCKGQPKV